MDLFTSSLLSIHNVQGIVLSAGNTLVNKAPALIELAFPKRKTDNEMRKIHGQDN